MKYLLGIDVGTTGTKAILFRQDGKLIGQAYQGYPIQTPNVGQCEQDPEDWWNSVCATVKQVTDDASIRSNIVAMAMSTQGGTMVGVDAEGKAVRPAMVWNDSRCAQEREQMKQDMPDLDVYRVCGWHPSDSMPALQCRWLQKHEPENFRKICRFLSVPDYLAWRMTGRAAIDISNAGICRFVDIQTKQYYPQLTDYAGLRQEQLPEILPSAVPIGTLTGEAAQALALPEEVLLISGAHDQYAVALGAGACKHGDILIGSGTSWVVTSLSDAPSFDAGLSQSVSAVPGLWGSLRSLSSGGLCLEWLRKKLTDDGAGTLLSYDTINREVARRNAATEDLFFFPFSGLRDAKNRFRKATFVGMDLSHDKFHFARAIMEGVAFQICWMMEAFQAKPGEAGIILAGGASKSQVWTQILADISGLPVQVPENPDLACVGAAVLAGVGCGIYSDPQQGYQELSVPSRCVLPDPDMHAQYQKYYIQYKETAEILGKLHQLK